MVRPGWVRRSAPTGGARGREHPLNVDPAVQLRLLDVQALDTRFDQLTQRRRALPEQAEAERLNAEVKAAQSELVTAQTEVNDVAREQRKAEADVEQVRTRYERDRKRLDAGQVGSPRELESLQHELETLSSRQADLEEVQLEVMERGEAAGRRAAELEARHGQLAEEVSRAEQARDAAYGRIDADLDQLRTERVKTAEGIPEELLTLYAKLRGQYEGVGAAALRQGRCEGCRMELNTSDLRRIAEAPADEVLRCEECRRILVRTKESGL